LAKWSACGKFLPYSSRVAVNSFPKRLKVVLVVVVLALRAGGVSFHRVLKRPVRQAVENHFKTIAELWFTIVAPQPTKGVPK
jgi:hypothetical protein